MGRIEGKPDGSDSEGREDGLDPYELYGDPGEWSFLQPFTLALRLMVGRPGGWLALCGLSMAGLLLLVAGLPMRHGGEDLLLLAGLPSSLLLALSATWYGNAILVEGHADAAELGAGHWLPRLPAVLATFVLLGLFLGSVAWVTFALVEPRDEVLFLTSLALAALGFRAGAFALPELLLTQASPLGALRGSWRLTARPYGIGFAVLLYASSQLLMVLIGVLAGATLPRIHGQGLVSIPLMLLLLLVHLVLLWSMLAWTAHYLAVKKRSQS